MSFQLVPNSVILDDLERRNSPHRSVILPNSPSVISYYYYYYYYYPMGLCLTKFGTVQSTYPWELALTTLLH